MLAVWQSVQLLRLLAAMFGYLAAALLKKSGEALVTCGLVEATMTESKINAPVMINTLRFGTLYSSFIFLMIFSFDWYYPLRSSVFAGCFLLSTLQ
jgi:hypothetical protein